MQEKCPMFPTNRRCKTVGLAGGDYITFVNMDMYPPRRNSHAQLKSDSVAMRCFPTVSGHLQKNFFHYLSFFARFISTWPRQK